jgi:chemotaxis protein MotB
MRHRRRRRVSAEAEAVSHDRWLVSYADFVTLLFAFFVVLFASAYRDRLSVVRVSQSIQSGFQVVSGFHADQPVPAPGGNLRVAANGLEAKAASPSPIQPPRQVGAQSNEASAPVAIQSSAGAAQMTLLSEADLVGLQQELQSAMGAELRNREVEMRSTPEGFVISLKELGFFSSGQAQLLPGAAEKIRRIAAILGRRQLDLRIEGHSDNQPIHTAQFRSNWELSTARAMTVLSLLVDDSGYDPRRLSVAGYGQFHPLADDSTAEGRRMNRRVDLVVQQTAGGPGQSGRQR